ncbi:PEP-CTERM sorting domain-containing protein [Lacipirellula sp.]|uniref:PEP-CTERM sorting domain-containing protein n=1 Tax=Lacipirellula sp. TaxID=2691419 RepID=UPI003D0F50EE
MHATTGSASPTSAAVPEPSTLLLGILGLVTLETWLCRSARSKPSLTYLIPARSRSRGDGPSGGMFTVYV